MDFSQHRLLDWLVATRRDFHMHPEISNQEHRTIARIKETLTSLGIKLQELKDVPTGTAALFKGTAAGPVLALRADIDALPMDELNDVPYKSQNPGVMHSCGHDCHATLMLGVARNVVETGLDKQLKGQLKISVPAGRGKGVRAPLQMIKGGVLENPRPDRIMACHVPYRPAHRSCGFFQKKSAMPAPMSSSCPSRGEGVHGASPHLGLDPVMAGAYFVTAAQSIVSRTVDPLENAVVTIGQFQAGSAPNIIPDEALLTGTTRTFSNETRELVLERLQEIARGLEKMFKVEVNFRVTEGVPVVRMTSEVTEALVEAARKVVGDDRIHWLEPKMGGRGFCLVRRRDTRDFHASGMSG